MDIKKIAALFGVGDVCDIREINGGHINRTYLAESSEGRFIIQAVDRNILKSPEIIAENIAMIERCIAARPDCGITVPHYLASDGKLFAEADGEIWRICTYIETTAPYSAYIHGFAAGRFLRVMNTSDAELKTAMKLHDFSGLSLPMRNIHGDTKADNIIFASPPAVIDLDTAMRGYAFVDLGDVIRSVTSECFDMEKVNDAIRGFACGVGDLLTVDEVNSLYTGTLMIVEELHSRYCEGKKHFPNKTPEQCRERIIQLEKQLAQLRSHENEIEEIIRKSFFA